MNILFRADSSSSIGVGHIMRDLVLASKYKDSNIVFATQNLIGNINHKIVESRYKIKILGSNDVKELSKLIKKLNIELLVIDHYDIDYKFEKKLKEKHPKLKILSFDDTYEKHHCDVLLNHNISADKKKYKGLVPEYCELRCGSEYTLIRDEFKKMSINKRKIKNKKKLIVFVAMGGSDSQNINLKILKVLSEFKNIYVHLVTTSSNINLKELNEFISKNNNINIYIDSKKMSYLMNKSDFAIISPSVISTEVIYMKLPFIVIKTADNQDDVYKFLKSKKFFTLESFNTSMLEYLVEKISDYKEYNKLKNRINKIKIKEKKCYLV
jgi:UDP-2,4-diacetamido-2,4,6-trideoxy-beta-L-altropyranose hydrolase